MKSKNIALSSLFGLIIFLQKFLLPAPYDKIVSVFIQITLLSLAFLIMGLVGPITIGFVSGLLTALMRGELALMSFFFALLYGILVGILNHLFGVVKSGRVKRKRLVVSAFISTMLIGVTSTSLSIALAVIPYNSILISVIIVSGAVQGLAGGYISNIIWEKYFRSL